MGSISILFRQTNIIWVIFVFSINILYQKQKIMKEINQKEKSIYNITKFFSNYKRIISRY